MVSHKTETGWAGKPGPEGRTRIRQLVAEFDSTVLERYGFGSSSLSPKRRGNFKKSMESVLLMECAGKTLLAKKGRRARRILFVDEDVSLVTLVGSSLERKGMKVFSARNTAEAEDALDRGERFEFIALVIKSPPVNEVKLLRRITAEIPECAVVVLANYGAINDVIVALKSGARDYLLKGVRPSQMLFTLDRITEKADLRGPRETSQLDHCRECRFTGVVYSSRRMRNVCHRIGTVANAGAPVLLQGEAGTGKDLFSHIIHCLSPRRLDSYTKVSCAAPSPEQLDARLFGPGDREHECFSAADSRGSPLAGGGTIYLDEVAELPMPIQAKLVQTLQDREFQGADGVTTHGLDVRIISSTRQNLEELVSQGKFREDLYYKLNVVSTTLPPLRKHKDDIMPLAEYFLDHFVDAMTRQVRGFSTQAEHCLREYDWPGNVRELRNVVHGALIRARGEKIEPRDLPEEIHPSEDTAELRLRLGDRSIDAAEEALIERVLIDTKGNISKSADILGVSRGTLYNKLKKYRMKK